jgi:four helix bundle protein
MSKQADEFKKRTKQLGVRIVTLVQSLPGNWAARTIGQQLLRSATSVGANYRAACRARSRAEFRAKLGICEEEADESIYWIELLAESGFVKANRVKPLLEETQEILAIIVASIRTSRRSA